jgi:hypothetical protein
MDMARDKKIACCVGALAGITPLLVSLISVDAELIVSGFDPMIFIGYLIKVLGMMTLGAFVVFVNSESDFKKAFQLGLMAPALIVGTINADNFSEAKQEILDLVAELENRISKNEAVHQDAAFIFQGEAFGFSLISNAYADSTNALVGKHTKPSTVRKVWYGVSGNISNGWFVIVGSYKQKRDADGEAQKLRDRGYDARVFPPFDGKRNYSVAIGSYLTLNEARALRNKAIKGGLPKSIDLWKWK